MNLDTEQDVKVNKKVIYIYLRKFLFIQICLSGKNGPTNIALLKISF